MGDALTNVEGIVNYPLINAEEIDVFNLNAYAIAPLNGTNIAVNGNLLISSGNSVTGATTGVHTGDVYGQLYGNSVGTHTGLVIGNVNGTTTGFTGALDGQVTGTMTQTQIALNTVSNQHISNTAQIQDTKLATITTAGKVANSATTATVSATPNTIALRDANGALTATAISSQLAGDIVGPTSATQIAAGVIVNADISSSAAIQDTKLATITTAGKVANSATSATTLALGNTIAQRDSNGNLQATTVTGSFSGEVSGTQSGLYINANTIVNEHINSNAAIQDTKLATIATAGKVSNSATTATTQSTPNTIALRDGNGDVAMNSLVTQSGTSVGGQTHWAMRNGSNRFIFGMYQAEGTGNAGGNLALWRYANDGSFLGSALLINRANGNIIASGDITIPAAAAFNGALIIPAGSAIGIRTSNGSAVPFPTGITLNNQQNISNVGTVYTNVLNTSNISGPGDISFINFGTGIDFGRHNLVSVKSLSINASVYGSDPATPIPLAMISGNNSNGISMTLGRTSAEAELAVSAGIGQYTTNSQAGDVVLRNTNTARNILLGYTNQTVTTINSSGMTTTNLRTAISRQELIVLNGTGGNQTIGTQISKSGAGKINISNYVNQSGVGLVTAYSGVIHFVWGWHSGNNTTTLKVTSFGGNVSINSVSEGAQSTITFQLLPDTGNTYTLTINAQNAMTIVLNNPWVVNMIKIRIEYDIE